MQADEAQCDRAAPVLQSHEENPNSHSNVYSNRGLWSATQSHHEDKEVWLLDVLQENASSL